jgi:hypothetical protein
MSYGNLLDWRCTKKARLMTQDISNSTRQKKSDAMFCSSRPATYKASVVTTTGTFNDDLSTLEIRSFTTSRTKLGCTSLIRDGRELSLCTRLQDQGRIAYSTLMAKRSQTPRISSIYAIFMLSQPRHLCMATYNLSRPNQGIDQTHVKDLVVTSFGPTVMFSYGNM